MRFADTVQADETCSFTLHGAKAMALYYRMRKHKANANHADVTAVAILVDGVSVQTWNFDDIIQSAQRVRILGLWFCCDWSLRVWKHGKTSMTKASHPDIIVITVYRGKKQIQIPQSVVRQGVRHTIKLAYVH